MICPQNIDLDLDPLPLFSTKLKHKLVWILSISILISFDVRRYFVTDP